MIIPVLRTAYCLVINKKISLICNKVICAAIELHRTCSLALARCMTDSGLSLTQEPLNRSKKKSRVSYRTSKLAHCHVYWPLIGVKTQIRARKPATGSRVIQSSSIVNQFRPHSNSN